VICYALGHLHSSAQTDANFDPLSKMINEKHVMAKSGSRWAFVEAVGPKYGAEESLQTGH